MVHFDGGQDVLFDRSSSIAQGSRSKYDVNCQEYLSLTISRNLIGQQLCHHRIRARQDPALGDRMVIRRGASSRCASGFRLSAVGLRRGQLLSTPWRSDREHGRLQSHHLENQRFSLRFPKMTTFSAHHRLTLFQPLPATPPK